MALADRDAIMIYIARDNPTAAIDLELEFETKAENARLKPKLSISAHRGRHFRLIVDGISAGSWTAFQTDRGRRFSVIVDDGGGAQVIF